MKWSKAQPEPIRRKRCAATATYDLIKRDLFRRAAAAPRERPGGLRQACRGSRRADGKSGARERGQRHRCDQLLGFAVARPAAGRGGGRRAAHADGGCRLHHPAGGRRQRRRRAADECRRDRRAAGDAGADRPPAPQPPAPARVECRRAGRSARAGAAGSGNRPPPAPAPIRRGRASTARMRGREARSRSARTAGLPRSTSTWPRSTAARSRPPTPAQRALLQSTRDRFLAYRDRCPNRRASPTPTSAGCARSATSWKAAGSPRGETDKWWISRVAALSSCALGPIFPR